jgi:hypothetical protein
MLKLYLRSGKAYIPTVARTTDGFFLEIEPVAVVDPGDAAALERELKARLAQGTPTVPTPTRDSFPKPVVLAHAGVKSWATFQKSALVWATDGAGPEVDYWGRLGPTNPQSPDVPAAQRMPATEAIARIVADVVAQARK